MTAGLYERRHKDQLWLQFMRAQLQLYMHLDTESDWIMKGMFYFKDPSYIRTCRSWTSHACAALAVRREPKPDIHNVDLWQSWCSQNHGVCELGIFPSFKWQFLSTYKFYNLPSQHIRIPRGLLKLPGVHAEESAASQSARTTDDP